MALMNQILRFPFASWFQIVPILCEIENIAYSYDRP